MQLRRFGGCDDLDADCEARAAGGACTQGTDAPLRCPSSCRVCSGEANIWQDVVEEAYDCSRLLQTTSCEEHRQRCARPGDDLPAVVPGSMTHTVLDAY